MIELSIQSHMEVAHFIPSFPEGHPNRRLHGHSYFITVTLRSATDVEMLEEYDVFKAKVESVVKHFDHTSANNWGLSSENPTMENMCAFLWKRFQEVLPSLHRLTLERPTLQMKVVYEGTK